ncbi:MAG: ABC transporter substrate-binding protein, partial [Senegalia sp. (in: firmicutes)]
SDTDKPIVVEGDGFPLKISDYMNVETIIEEPFENAAVLSGTPLNIWYDLGGKSICSSNISENVRLIPEYEEEIKSLPQIGPVYSINMEAVIEQKPDFIIAQVGTQSGQAKKLRDMGFKVITTHIRGYEDVLYTYEAFGKILDQEKLAMDRIKDIEKQKKDIESKAPKNGDTVIILYITGNSLAAKLNNSIAGDVAKILGLKNIASDLPPDTIGSENTPLDIEYIVEKNPDYVLVTSMVGSNEKAKEMMDEEFATNPIWEGVDAVSEDKVIYLPQQYFLFNAGPYYGDAIEYMARSIYPEIYGNVEELDE